MTKENQNQKDEVRSFSPFYEKVIPIAIITIVVIIVGVLLLTLGIAFGWFQAS
jgi:hypothetical protein